MSHERARGLLSFYCDGPDCDVSSHCNDSVPFTVAKEHIEQAGWTSTKQVGRAWEDFCPLHRQFGVEQHTRYKQREAQRGRRQ